MQNTESEYINAETPHLVEDQVILTKNQKIADVVKYMKLKSMTVSDDKEIIVMSIYLGWQKITEAITSGFAPIYDCINFFDKHFPNYNYDEFVRSYTDKMLIADAVLDPKKYGHKDLTIEEVFSLDELEAKDFEETNRLEFTTK